MSKIRYQFSISFMTGEGGWGGSQEFERGYDAVLGVYSVVVFAVYIAQYLSGC